MGAVLATKQNSTILPWTRPRRRQTMIPMACGRMFRATCTLHAMEEARFLFCPPQVNCSRNFPCQTLQLLPIWLSVVRMGPPSMRLVVAVLQAGVMAMVALMLSALIILVENGAGSTVFQNQQPQSVHQQLLQLPPQPIEPAPQHPPQLLRAAPPHTPPPTPVLQQPLLRVNAWVMIPAARAATR